MGCSSVKEKKSIPKNACVIEVRSWSFVLLENIVLKKRDIKSSGPELYAIILSKSKCIKSKQYWFPKLEDALFNIKPNDPASRRSSVPFSSTNLPELSDKRCFIIVEKNMPIPPKPLDLGDERHIIITATEVNGETRLVVTKKKIVGYLV